MAVPWGTIIMIVILGALAVLVWRFEDVKRMAVFLLGGLLFSLMIVMIGRIWIANLSAWWILIVEAVLVVTMILKGKYVD